jgi:hypothetical protein
MIDTVGVAPGDVSGSRRDTLCEAIFARGFCNVANSKLPTPIPLRKS